jgi:chemotaxis protein histidine kinase CheA
MLSSTIAQEVNQGGVHYSNTNSQSKSFRIEEGKQTIDIGFGRSDQPLTLKVDLNFDYKEKEDRTVDLDQIIINFIQDESQKQNNENKVESKSEKVKSEEEQQSQQSMSERMQQMQQQMNDIFKNQEKEQEQNTQQKVQNNQMAQDSNAIKQQMQKQLEEQKKTREEFQKNLANNEEFQKQHQELAENGYNPTSSNLNPTNNTSGDFELNYEKEGETASIKGSMENNEIKDIQKSTSEDSKKLMDQLDQDPRFNKFDQRLKNDSFSQQKPEISQQGNITNIEVPYINENNETATIKAIIEDDEIKEVKLEKEGGYYWNLFLLIILAILVFFYKKNTKKQEINGDIKKIEKPIDYRKEALKILEKAKQLFEKGKEKDAYGKTAEAIRLYYSHKLGSKTEITNTDLIKLLKKNKIDYNKTQECLNLCGLVGFAKYKANRKDFDEIIKLGKKIII